VSARLDFAVTAQVAAPAAPPLVTPVPTLIGARPSRRERFGTARFVTAAARFPPIMSWKLARAGVVPARAAFAASRAFASISRRRTAAFTPPSAFVVPPAPPAFRFPGDLPDDLAACCFARSRDPVRRQIEF
jgi:hypothetical protein